MKKNILIIIFLQTLLFTGCTECLLQSGRSEYYEIVKTPITNKSERVRKFSMYPPERQIDVYLFAARCSDDPSVMGLFTEISKDRIPDIVKRIQVSKSEEDKHFLIRILSDTNWQCRCIDQGMIEILSAVQSEISPQDNESEKFYKESYKKYLEHIINLPK